MQIITNIKDYKNTLAKTSGTIGFVPTMGALHEGHLELIRQSIKDNDNTVVSIFVNPLQFGPKEDFAKYPRSLERDKKLLEQENVDILFCPSDTEMYPEKLITEVSVSTEFEKKLCGKYRPEHFKGVATVVTKLFNIIQPDNSYFGLKDYQQYVLIKKMVNDLNQKTNIIGLPTVREKSGLAMSSRNANLSKEEKVLAENIYKALQHVKDFVIRKQRIISLQVDREFSDFLRKISPQYRIQYVEVYNRDLEVVESYSEGKMFVACAVYLGRVRLIDNILF